MARPFNKSEFILELSRVLSYSQEMSIIITEIIENHFFITSKGKEKIIDEFILKLKIDDQEAERIYEFVIQIIKNELKNKLKHPFK